MKALFLLCTAVTILQVLDVSITGVSAATTPDGTDDLKTKKLRLTNREVKKPNPTPKYTKPADDPASPDPVDNDPGTNPNDDDSAEAEPPKTFKESGKKFVKTFKKMATNRGVRFLNGVTGFLKKTGGAFNFFGNFLRDRANGVKEVAKESLGMISSFGDSTTRGAKHLLNSGKVIGKQAGKEMYSSLQKGTKLGVNVTKLGGTAFSTPMSIGEDVVGTTNRLAKMPSRVSKMITNGAINPVLNMFGSESGEKNPEEEEEELEDKEEELEDKEEEGEEEKEEPPKAPVKKPSTPLKPAPKQEMPKQPMPKQPMPKKTIPKK
ncbi:uncharacterized protein LOC100159063 precursor [Acyrthosiphon pisum]|uniref:ACYPI000472 protein n=1 Tax=Acyrthosiphon pisum TaxID=7029 RepID=C4WYF4_ACYPI|nr:uncharacterized protein LOC100159063 precursor [Acyrthosiphon pisum]BAH72924.1 ACYPI000472 [Acyrthosiphon pisum]|eukprot:NP_001155386.1 uncharacterized protein LOC100159063 precursor [Acyrthosiphon pisum]